ncbi:MAG TPA: hypothetical protein VN429_06485, partial [Methanospirillum sp.]|uniref:hypothetical protein n=1 Tax=Methanospirillum sp. TaxID=45200 RepID=UPI002B8586B9
MQYKTCQIKNPEVLTFDFEFRPILSEAIKKSRFCLKIRKKGRSGFLNSMQNRGNQNHAVFDRGAAPE